MRAWFARLVLRLQHIRFRVMLFFYKRKLMRLARHCKLVDELFKLNGTPRCERKRFWRAFYKRAAVLEDLLNEIDWDEA